MRQQISFLTQSRFYSPVFNSAIFDGPVRIYFSQYQEPLALKIYFNVQEKMKEFGASARDAYRRTGINIFVMLYPSADAFHMSFDEVEPNQTVVVERLGSDFVVGVKGPVRDEDLDMIYARIEDITKSIIEANPPAVLREALEVQA